MKKICTLLLIGILVINVLFICSNNEDYQVFKIEDNKKYNVNMKRDILSLMMGYSGHIVDIDMCDDKVYLIMKSGNKILYDDKKNKTMQEKINNPDLQDMMEEAYNLNCIDDIADNDPGRIRHYQLLQEVYGNTKKQIEINLKNFKFGNKYYAFNDKNNAYENLKKSINEVVNICKSNNEMYKYIYPISGTFNYRIISGTSRLSPHSFGIAIDLASDKSDYWKWASKEAGQKRLKSYPDSLVKTFENNNFIWGGKWKHFDILHFEYRPEFIYKSKHFNDNVDGFELWYKGADIKDKRTMLYIDLINNKIK
ncbi:M15 family metallopeptidase [Tepidibacter hydrothermalis]|uniref:M15 family metallopeptidase n=1 Tax=Tepidibacter hydrothermalis TaxID=3036126 RepID=A0ABY8EIY4_9FIRM|nr:M15 family metallopeptidase [Tepidibacter hydrothermalis]WFD11667.1 M15 family metallopeptidase [Tepidibacter hydrothermalis]